MGARGPVPQPAHVRLLQGAGTAGEPAKVVAPSAPSWLDREALAEWRRTVSALTLEGRLTRADRALLAAHATAWSRYVAVERRLSEYTAPGSKGQETSAPLFGVWKALHERVCATSAALGLHVTARARLPEAPPAKRPDSAWDRLDELGR